MFHNYIELRIWNQVSHDHRSFERNLSNCEQKPEKVRTSTGFEPVTSRYRCNTLIPVQCCNIMRFMVLHNRHHKVSQSVSFFMHRKTVTILLRIRARGDFVMSITKTHESHYVGVLDNPRHSNQLSYEATDVGSWSFVNSNEPVKNGCEVIYEMFHILNHKWTINVP